MPEGQTVGEKTPRTSSFSILTSMMPRQVMLSASSNSMSNGSKAIPSLTAEQRKLLLQAVCQFLELNGFSKTLKKLLSEAQIEKDSSKNSLYNLEDMCSQYLAMRASSDGDNKNNKKLDKQNVEITGVGNGTEPIASKDEAKKEKKKQSKTHTEGNDVEASQQSEIVKNCDEDANLKSKKKKSSSNDSLPNVEDTPFEDVTRDEKSSKKSKEKKKSKSGPNSSVENLKQKQEEGLQRVKEETKISSDAEKKSKSKSEKKMKVSSSIESVEDKNGENKQGDDTNESGDHEDGMKKEKKSSKKRKRVSEENEVEELQQSKTDGSTEMKVSDSKEDNMVESQTPAAGKHSNGFLEHNGGDKSTGQKSSKKQKTAGSTEPKSVNAFRRVDPDKVVIDDERLQDNSYWAKDGADSGYGAKAQEILGQVRGRDFRHEKTKKKRGSYRGGQIDQNSHSIKFNYSDEDE